MPLIKARDQIKSTLDAAITNSATSLVIPTDLAGLTIESTGWLTVANADESVIETMQYTAVTPGTPATKTTFTVVRAATANTTPQAFSLGDTVVLGVTSEYLNQIIDGVLGLQAPREIHALAMDIPTGGTATLGKIDLTDGVDVDVWLLDNATDESIDFDFWMPKMWDAGTVTVQAVWRHGAATAFTLSLDITLYAVGDNVDDPTFTGLPASATVTLSDTGGITNRQYITPASAALTVGGSPTGNGEMIRGRITRKTLNDTLDTDAAIQMLLVNWTAKQANNV